MDFCGNDWKQVKEIMEMRNFITISAKRRSLYISKCFRRQLKGKVEISINPQKSNELILTDNRDGICKATYGCSKLWRQLENIMGEEHDVRFIFFRSEDGMSWTGHLLPSWEVSYLWDAMSDADIAKETDSEQSSTLRKICVYYIKRRYWRFIETEEVEFCYGLGKLMADRYGENSRQKFIFHILYTNELSRFIARMARRCSRCEAGLSLNAEISGNTGDTYAVFFGTLDGSFSKMVVEEFKRKLTAIENWVLGLLMQEINVTKSITFSERTREYFNMAVRSLQKRAIDYFGQDYIRSMFVSDGANHG